MQETVVPGTIESDASRTVPSSLPDSAACKITAARIVIPICLDLISEPQASTNRVEKAGAIGRKPHRAAAKLPPNRLRLRTNLSLADLQFGLTQPTHPPTPRHSAAIRP